MPDFGGVKLEPLGCCSGGVWELESLCRISPGPPGTCSGLRSSQQHPCSLQQQPCPCSSQPLSLLIAAPVPTHHSPCPHSSQPLSPLMAAASPLIAAPVPTHRGSIPAHRSPHPRSSQPPSPLISASVPPSPSQVTPDPLPPVPFAGAGEEPQD